MRQWGPVTEDREIRPGWLPPKAPTAAPSPPAGGQRPVFVPARRVVEEGPSSPLAVMAVVMSALSLVLLILSVGVAWGVSSLLSLVALGLALTARQRVRAGLPGRERQTRNALVVASVGLVLAAVSAAVWLGLESNGITPQDLQDWLQRELERRRAEPSS